MAKELLLITFLYDLKGLATAFWSRFNVFDGANF